MKRMNLNMFQRKGKNTMKNLKNHEDNDQEELKDDDEKDDEENNLRK